MGPGREDVQALTSFSSSEGLVCLWTARATLSFQSQALLEGSAPPARRGQTSDSFPKLEGLQVFSGAATPAHSSFLISQPGNCDGFRSSNAWVGVGSW